MHGRCIPCLVALALLASFAGCAMLKSRKLDRMFVKAFEASDERAAAVPLAPAPSDGSGRSLAPLLPSTRVLVTRTQVSVDNAALVTQVWEEAKREPGFDSAKDGTYGLMIDKGPLVPDEKALDEALGLARTTEDLIGKKSYIEIWLARDVPYEIVTRVLDAAAQAGYSAFGIVLEGRDGPGAIVVDALPTGGDEPYTECLEPLLHLVAGGVQVRALSTTPAGGVVMPFGLGGIGHVHETGDAFVAASEPIPPLSNWQGRLVLASADACPSVPHVGGALDTAALVDLLGKLGTLADPCPTTLVSADPSIEWSLVAALLDAVVLAAGHAHPRFAVQETDAPANCADGLPFEALVRARRPS